MDRLQTGIANRQDSIALPRRLVSPRCFGIIRDVEALAIGSRDAENNVRAIPVDCPVV